MKFFKNLLKKFRYKLAHIKKRTLAWIVLIVFIACVFTLGSVAMYDFTFMKTTSPNKSPNPFPVSVDPHTETITDNPEVDNYLQNEFAITPEETELSWRDNLAKKLAKLPWFQNIASPGRKMLVIWPGDRHEQVTDNFGDILGWNDKQREVFSKTVKDHFSGLPEEGIFIPGKYNVANNAEPKDVAQDVINRFNREIYSRYDSTVSEKLSLEDALTFASLLEREAHTFAHKREIAGVIWNRLFNDMKLQLDATLQYAKGSIPSTPEWWPRVLPSDKFIDSPYNTYQNKGLPPAPIANPSALSVIAALNPNNTDCLFYFHDDYGKLHCSQDYEAHRQKLINMYGQGR